MNNQVILKFQVCGRSHESRLVETKNLDRLPFTVRNEIIGMANKRPKLGTHNFRHPAVDEPVVVYFLRRKVSNLAVLLDFIELEKNCKLLALLITHEHCTRDEIAGKIEVIVTLGAMLRDESYVLGAFPEHDLSEAGTISLKDAHKCLVNMCRAAKAIIRSLNAEHDDVERALPPLLHQATLDLEKGILRLRVNIGIAWT